jgi:ammonia channel protein AmtB
MMSFAAIGVTTIIWVLYGYSLAFGKSQGGLIGSLDHLGLAGTIDQITGAEGHQIPVLAFAMFQLTFAIITVSLLSGAIADRAKYGSWVLFVARLDHPCLHSDCSLGLCCARWQWWMDYRQPWRTRLCRWNSR